MTSTLNVEYLEKGDEVRVPFDIIGEYGYHNHVDDENVNFQGIVRVVQ